MVAALALNTQETVGQNPTAQVFIKFFYHKTWKRIAGVIFNLSFERQPVVLDKFVKDRFFGLVSGVSELFFCKIGVCHEGIDVCKSVAMNASVCDGSCGNLRPETYRLTQVAGRRVKSSGQAWLPRLFRLSCLRKSPLVRRGRESSDE